MSDLAAYLLEKREEAGLTIEDLHHSTKIRRYYLESLEKGDFDVLPNEVYFRGYLRAIARELSADYNHMLELYDGGASDGKRVPSSYEGPIQQYDEPSMMQRNGKLIFIVASLGLLALALGYYFLIYAPSLQ